MKIEELTTGQSVLLSAKIGGEILEFETVIQDTLPRRHAVLADVVIKNDKVLTFHAKGLIVDLHYSPPDSSPMVFKNVAIALMRKSDNSYCYSISTIAEGKVLNRRQNFRTFIGRQSSVQCGTNRAAYDAVIRDISSTGFAVVLDSEVEFHENQVLHTVLNDQLEEFTEPYNFQLYGIIVRVQELENNLTLYGCRLNNKVQGLDAYIMKKERLRLKRMNGD